MELWSPAVHDLLRYLEEVDSPTPRVVDAEGVLESRGRNRWSS